MNKSECFVGQIVYFTCHGRDSQGSRGGHYSVKAEVVKVAIKNARLVELKGSYNPGQRWQWPISELRTLEQDQAHKRGIVKDLAEQYPHLAGMISK